MTMAVATPTPGRDSGRSVPTNEEGLPLAGQNERGIGGGPTCWIKTLDRDKEKTRDKDKSRDKDKKDREKKEKKKDKKEREREREREREKKPKSPASKDDSSADEKVSDLNYNPNFLLI